VNDFNKDFNKSIGETLDWVGSWLYQSCQNFVEEAEEIAIEIEAATDVLLAPVYDWLDEVDEMITGTSRPFVQTVSPVLQDHPACVGCANYHGETYGENLLVCAMHPYGAEGRTCSDWQSVWEDGSD
jgi:hypothetical protein